MERLIVLFFLGALGFAQVTDRPSWKAPATAASRENPLKNRPDLVAGGKRVFQRNCARCHGAAAYQKAPDLSGQALREESDGSVFWKISTGNSRSGMPGYGSLPEGQRWQLVLYIRSLGE